MAGVAEAVGEGEIPVVAVGGSGEGVRGFPPHPTSKMRAASHKAKNLHKNALGRIA